MQKSLSNIVNHCFIRKNSEELRNKLKQYGIRQNDFDDNRGEWIAYNYGLYISVDKGHERLFPDEIDCGTDEEMFINIILKKYNFYE